ncbi:unnamed protein product, partial [Candidula unifasciata]
RSSYERSCFMRIVIIPAGLTIRDLAMSETEPTSGPEWPAHWKPVVLTRFRPIRPEDSSQ